MRNMLVFGLFVLAGTVAVPTLASDLSVVQDNGQGSLRWHSGKDALVLRSGEGKGVRVIDAKPDGIFGLHPADDILAVDGHAVNSVSALLDGLRATRSASAQLRVLRRGAPQIVLVAVRDYQRFMPPEPPAAPVPPVPPMPPMPPPPPMPPMPQPPPMPPPVSGG